MAILVAILLVAFLVSRSCGSSGREIDQERAVEIARAQLDFEPECKQVRFLRRGFKGRPQWAVSLWSLDSDGQFERVTLVLVDSLTGRVAQVNRRPNVGGTSPQCESPV